MTDALVEAVARVAARQYYIDASNVPIDADRTETLVEANWDFWAATATVALQAIEAAGYRVVPVDATEDATPELQRVMMMALENAGRLKEASQTWQDMESAPTDGTDFLAAVMMVGDDGRRWWEQHVIYVDQETGEIAQDVERGVDLSDYHCWMPLPPNPGEVAGGQA